MKRLPLVLALLVAPALSQAETRHGVIKDIVDAHILPRFETLAQTTKAFSDVAAQDCTPSSARLRRAYATAFDAWISASHLRFGPTEAEERAFALAFWPDSRGATPRALASLMAAQDPISSSVAHYAEVSIAARGFYALEFLLYDATLMSAGDPAYHCQLLQTLSADAAATSRNILAAWQSPYADHMLNAASGALYRNDEDVLQELFKSLSTGLQFTADTRLGRPLGSFERPRPARAEAVRSGRSSRHVKLSLDALKDLALRLAGEDRVLKDKLAQRFDTAMGQLSELKDPTFAGVSTPLTRFRIEVLQQSITAIRSLVRDELGPKLGVSAGFNALDGD